MPKKQPPKASDQPAQLTSSDYRDMLMNAPAGAFTTTSDGKFLFANEALAHIFGYDSPEELMDSVNNIGTQLYADPNDRTEILRLLEENDEILDYECRFHRKDGSTFWASYSIRVVRDEKGNIANYQGFFSDITERKQEQESLRRTQFAMDTAPDSIIWLDSEANIVYVNESSCVSVGYTREELLKMKIFDIDPDYNIDKWEQLKADMRRFGTKTFETCHRTKDGHIFPVEVRTNDFMYKNHFLACTFDRDISERKNAEKALKESEEHFRTLFMHAPVPFVQLTFEGKIIGVNDLFTRILGYTIEDIPDVDHWWINAYPDPDYRRDTQSAWEKAVSKAIAANTDVESGEYRVTCKNGTEFTMIIRANVIGDMVLVSFYDVTEIREKESALQESMELLRATFDATNEGILVVNKDMKITQVNQQFYDMWHIPPELQENYDDTVMREFVKDQLVDPDGFQNMAQELYQSSEQDIYELHFKDGRVFERYSAPVTVDGKEIGRVWSFQDISEKKRAEQALKESESRFRTLFKMAPIPMADISRDGRIIDVNDSLVRTMGYTLDDVPTLEKAWERSMPDPVLRNEISSKWKAAFDQAITDNSEIEPLECELLFKDGTMHTMVINTKLISDSIIISFFDITEHKKAEESIDFERRQLLSIFDNFNDIVYVADPDTYEMLYANRYLQELIGKDPTGKLCYEELQELDKPCEFCTNSIILNYGGLPYKWEYHNPVTDIDVAIVDQIIRWPDGRDVRLEIATDITERKKAEKELKKSESKLRSIFSAMTDVILILDSKGHYIEIAPTNTDLLYRPAEELVGKSIRDVFPPEKANEFLEVIHNALSGQKTVFLDYELVIESRNIWFASSIAPLSSDRVILVARDITARKEADKEREKLQQQLAQAHKLEAVGILAGGVAHDFNNMLGAIIGYTELTIGDMKPADQHRDNLTKILDVAQRSAKLTRQLLAFARKQTVEPVILDLNESIEAILKMIRRLIGENIELSWQPHTNSCKVKMDPTQLDQLLMNLCVNAKDAIADIGRISIETDRISFDEEFCESHAEFVPGTYVLLVVSDNGSGMSKETMEHIFEPFYTTKDVGQGTGMGLATVYGIVKQNDGFINVYSEPDHGTMFKIYFPYNESETKKAKSKSTDQIPKSRGETLLIVEDDPSLLRMSIMMLQRLGYTVVSASTPNEALRIAREYSQRINLVVTDVIMPEMNGRELVERLEEVLPNMKYLFISGYTADVIAHEGGMLDEGVHFLQKPFSLKDLARKVREMLD